MPSKPVPPVVRAAFEHTAILTRAHSKTFYFATALLPEQARHAIRALYAFCRATDDLVDVAGATPEDVAQWRHLVNLPLDEQTDPNLLGWAWVRQAYGVDERYQDELIDGVALDLTKTRYTTWNELARYCYLVASTVGLLSMPIIGLAGGVTFQQAAPYAIKLGMALQLINILRDVGEDAGRGRVYLPQADLHRFGLTAEDILHGVCDERFVALMRFEMERARALFAEALPGIALLAPAARPAVGAAALLYHAILNEIERLHYRVFEHRAHTTGWQKLALLPGILLTVAGLKRPTAPLPDQAIIGEAAITQ